MTTELLRSYFKRIVFIFHPNFSTALIPRLNHNLTHGCFYLLLSFSQQHAFPSFLSTIPPPTLILVFLLLDTPTGSAAYSLLFGVAFISGYRKKQKNLASSKFTKNSKLKKTHSGVLMITTNSHLCSDCSTL